jgi:hypothetical protein
MTVDAGPTARLERQPEEFGRDGFPYVADELSVEGKG